MTAPFVYVGTWTIKEGKVDEARRRLAEHVDLIEANEPRMIAFHLYLDDDARTASVVQVHPDSASMEFHMELIAAHLAGAFDYIDTILTEQYYGPMSDALAETLAKYEDPGVTVIKRPVFEAGFTRASVR
jgi:quinol monooxygenase YgiN